MSPRSARLEGTVTRIAPKQRTLKEMLEQGRALLIDEALRDHGQQQDETAPRSESAEGQPQEAREVRVVRPSAAVGESSDTGQSARESRGFRSVPRDAGRSA